MRCMAPFGANTASKSGASKEWRGSRTRPLARLGPRPDARALGPRPDSAHGPERTQACAHGPWPDSALGPTRTRLLAQLGPRPDARACKLEKRAKMLCVLLYTPPRWVSSPGTPTEGQRRAFTANKIAEDAVTAMHFLKSAPCKRTRPLVGQNAGVTRLTARAAVGKRGRLPKRTHERSAQK
jgi:hypothetical protein